MRLEPVFLVAPEPEPDRRSISRRSFVLGLSGATLAGFGLGWVASSGRGQPVSSAPEAATPEDPKDLERLQWALALQKGPIEDLVGNYQTFLWIAGVPLDARMELGVQRMCDAILDGTVTDAQVREELTTTLVMTIEPLGPQHPLSRYWQALRNTRRR